MFYNLLKAYIALGLHYFFKRIIVVNQKNIPENGPILFVANHQNALVDALLIATNNRRQTYFLTRADAFKNKLVQYLLERLKMLPVFRIRDGISTVNQNNAIFEQCFDLLNNGYCIGIFPEGNHDLKRRLRPLSKGFTRIALGTVEKYQTELTIMPVGINYSAHQNFRGSVSLYFGKAIHVKDFYTGNFNSDSVKLKAAVSAKMKNLIVHIEDTDNYEKILSQLKANGADFLNPFETNLAVENIDHTNSMASYNTKSRGKMFLANVLSMNSLIPLLLWNRLYKTIKDPVMIATFKFCFGVFVFPLFYLAQGLIIISILNVWAGLAYLVFSVLTAPILAHRNILK